MTNKVLILGGYGNFGKRIAVSLARKGTAVIIAGRSRQKAETLAATLPGQPVEIAELDADLDLAEALSRLKPKVVINTCGPFQSRDYRIAEACIALGIHYLDLADARDFVTGIVSLDAAAQRASVAVISGASTVPCLSSAVVEHFLPQFSALDSIIFGIAPGQKAERGLATTEAILSYVGKRMRPCAGEPVRYGWQGLYRQAFPLIGSRWMANCDVPDLDLFPPRYGLKAIRFSAGLENPLIHLGLWCLSWLVRLGLPLNLPRHAGFLLKAAAWFDRFGTADGGMFVTLNGVGHDGRLLKKSWFIIAKNGDGPHIPAVPAILLAERLVQGTFGSSGASTCAGLVSLEDYLRELSSLHVTTHTV